MASETADKIEFVKHEAAKREEFREVLGRLDVIRDLSDSSLQAKLVRRIIDLLEAVITKHINVQRNLVIAQSRQTQLSAQESNMKNAIKALTERTHYDVDRARAEVEAANAVSQVMIPRK